MLQNPFLDLYLNSFSKILLTTSANTNVRTLSPISGEMSDPNCCNVVRNLFSLLSWRAPHAGGSCWLTEELTRRFGDIVPPFILPIGEWLPDATKITRTSYKFMHHCNICVINLSNFASFIADQWSLFYLFRFSNIHIQSATTKSGAYWIALHHPSWITDSSMSLVLLKPPSYSSAITQTALF